MNTLNSCDLNKFYLKLREMYKQFIESYFISQVAINAEEIAKNLLIREYWLCHTVNNHADDIGKQISFCNNTLAQIYKDAENVIAKFKRVDCDMPVARQEDMIRFLSHDSLFYLACNTIEHRSKRSSMLQICDSDYEYEGDICIIPKEGYTDNKTLFLSYGSQFMSFLSGLLDNNVSEQEKEFVKKYGIEEYCYWNNTDCPEELSEDKWEQRRKDWDRACGKGSPVQNGFAMPMMTDAEVSELLFTASTKKSLIAEKLSGLEAIKQKAAAQIIQESFLQDMWDKEYTPEQNQWAFIRKCEKEYSSWKQKFPNEYNRQIKEIVSTLEHVKFADKDALLKAKVFAFIPSFENCREQSKNEPEYE